MVLLICISALSPECMAVSISFGDLSLAAESYENGAGISHDSNKIGSFSSGGATFNNYYDPNCYGSTYWEQWAYSNRTDTESTGVTAQYTAMTQSTEQTSGNYGIGFSGWYAGVAPTMVFATPTVVESADFTNNAYVYHTLLDGDTYSKKFGYTWNKTTKSWDNTKTADWFILTITGKDAVGNATGTVDFYLADYRFDEDANDYAVRDWTTVTLASLGKVSSLEFDLSSSDTGDYGINTPTYFAMDNLTITPEPSTITLAIIGLLACWGWRRRSTAL
jgi:hypothetical protein